MKQLKRITRITAIEEEKEGYWVDRGWSPLTWVHRRDDWFPKPGPHTARVRAYD